MALPVPVPAALRVNLLWDDGADGNLLTRLHFAYAGDAPAADDCVSIATAIYELCEDNLLPQMSSGQALRGVDVIDLSSDDAHTGTYLALFNGSLGGAPLPAGVCALVNYGIARRYRGGKPRSYFPFGDVTKLASPSFWTGAFQTSVNNALTTVFTGIASIVAGTTTLGGPINISYSQGYGTPRARSNGHLYYPPQPRVTPLVDPIASHNLNLRPGSQRRRAQH